VLLKVAFQLGRVQPIRYLREHDELNTAAFDETAAVAQDLNAGNGPASRGRWRFTAAVPWSHALFQRCRVRAIHIRSYPWKQETQPNICRAKSGICK
jgi:hypothetical protein